MSIQSEINRISQNVADSLTAVAAKGVVVPNGSNSDDLPELIASIQTGSGSAVTVTDTLDANGGIIRTISAVSLAGDTVTPSRLLSGTTAHNAMGQSITGTYEALPCPIFDIVNDAEGHEVSITCNKTFAECVALFESQTYQSLSAIVRETGETDPETPDVWDHAYTAGWYSSGPTQSYIRYYSTTGRGIPRFQLTYYSDGTIVNTAENLDGLVSLDVTENGTYTLYPEYVYDTVTVHVPPSSTPNLQSKSGINPSTSSQTITADSGYDGLSSVQINAMPIGSASLLPNVMGTSATVSTGTNTLTLSKQITITPYVEPGYISSGEATECTVSLTASVTTKSAATITPTKSTQTIASGTYLTGTQTIAAIPAAYQDVTGVTATASDVVSGKDIVNSSGTVVHGSLVIQHYYTGSGAPSSSTGVNGDIYLQTS